MWQIEAVKSSKNVVRMGVCYYRHYSTSFIELGMSTPLT